MSPYGLITVLSLEWGLEERRNRVLDYFPEA